MTFFTTFGTDKRTPIGPTRWSVSATFKEGATRAIVSNWGVEGQIDRPPVIAITNTAMFTELLLGGKVYDGGNRTDGTDHWNDQTQSQTTLR